MAADEAKSPVEDAGTTVTAAELKAAIEEVLDNTHEWEFEDLGHREINTCPSCGWNTEDGPWPMAHKTGLDHHAGCKLKAALELLRAFVEG